MNAGVKLAGYALVLAAAFGGGAAVGAAVGPIQVTDDEDHGTEHPVPATAHDDRSG